MKHHWISCLSRRCLLFAAASFVIAISPLVAQSQTTYPTKNIRVIVPSPTGGPSDIVARLLGDKLAASLGKQVVIDNRTGASQIIGSGIVAKAEPDGYTLLQAAANMSINPIMVKDMPYDTIKDFAPVSMTHITPYVVIVSGQSSARTLPELLKFIRGNPGKVTYGVTGPGSPHQLATLLMSQLSGGLTGMTEVQYKGSTPAHPDIIANRITFMIDPLAAASPHIKSGSLRALAVSTPQRNPSFPDVPAVAEVLPGYDFASWGGVFAPAGTPRAVVEKLNAAIGAALATPDITKRFNDMGLVPKHGTPEAFGQFLQSEIQRWRALLAKKP
jgi:tripartite-type tricarboxylate transporter receptor subunit TctC